MFRVLHSTKISSKIFLAWFVKKKKDRDRCCLMRTRQPWRASLQAPAQGSGSRWPWAQNHHGDWHLVGCLEQERAWKSPSLAAALPSEAYWEHRMGKMPGHCQAEPSCPLKSRLLQPPGASSCCLSEPEWILRKSVQISCGIVRPLRFHSKPPHRMTLRQDHRGF